jgi:hypothetical protein
MSLSGIYKVIQVMFDDNNVCEFELHIKEDKSGIRASLKGPTQNNYFTRTFYNGRTFKTPNEKESHVFIFYNVQLDDYINIVPPGGYHIGGVEFAGTVVCDKITGTIKLKNGLILSLHGTRIEGEPVISSEIRNDVIAGINLACPCVTISCSHHGFCDSCHIFDSSHGAYTRCMYPQYRKQYLIKYGKEPPNVAPPEGPPGEHGPHNLVEP